MLEEYNPLSRIPDNSKFGITLCLNKGEGGDPFEATLFFKKSGKTAEEMIDEKAITITASGKIRFNIGKNGHIELFAEQSNRLNEGDTEELPDVSKDDSIDV